MTEPGPGIVAASRMTGRATGWTGALAMIMVCGVLSPPAAATSLRDAITTAWAQDPNARSARVDEMAASRTARDTDSWFPTGPILNGQYQDDHFIGTNIGYTTYQGTIMLPLWLPGQGTATVKNALADAEMARATQKVAHLATAIRVLDVTGTATLLRRELDSLRTADALLARIEHDTRHAVAVGESPTTDQEAVAGEKADLDARIADTEQNIETARAELGTLTGSEDIPDLMALDGHVLTARGVKLDPEHDPRILLAAAATRAAHASYEVAAHSYMPAPEVGLMVTKQGQYGSPWDTQVGAQFTVALPNAARNTPILMKQARLVGQAERDAVLAERKVRLEYASTRAQLVAALKLLKSTRASQGALDDRANQLDHAWRVGETSLIETLRARRMALDAQMRAARAEVVWRVALVRMVLMANELP